MDYKNSHKTTNPKVPIPTKSWDLGFGSLGFSVIFLALFILLGWSCRNSTPLQPNGKGQLHLKISWAGKLAKSQTIAHSTIVDQITVTVSRSNGTTIASTELALSGNNWHGSIKLDPANNLTVAVEAFENSQLRYSGSTAGVTIEAGKTSSVNIIMNSIALTAPNLLQPQNGASLNTNNVSFTWSSVNGAAGYHLQVDDASTFSSPVLEDSTLLLTNFTPGTTIADGAYFWRVRARDSAGNWSNWAPAWNFLIDTQPASTPVLFINEFLATNKSCCTDEFGDNDDWIEIYNPGSAPVDIGGMFVTNDLRDLTFWRIPNTQPDTTTIQPGGFLLLWVDKEPEQGILHVNFKLGGSGEQIGLTASDATVIDSLSYNTQNQDISMGRKPDGSDNWVTFITPTPGASNN